MRYLVQTISVVMLLSACSEPDAPNAGASTLKSQPAADKPVQKKALYAFDEWAGQGVKSISPSNVNDVLDVLGMSSKKKTDVLDYTGERGTMFHLRDPNKAEFLNVVNSVNAMELNWIKPSDGDGVDSKKVSVENTQKAYQFARSVLGDKGGELVKSMVTTPDFTAPEIVNGTVIKAAACEHFSCTLVIEK